ncbi:GNAT family N-acetyltransferase [Paenibacillus protaetiae]|uniref:GNAT family N-acetyltransferase n=1 Tax=Paenibacillus protaetiae TaxID=2509456 RepID=A0A4P6EVM0_9BACL|nr:GNAT family N-acetyltransferase [Paenibacillus protaetiae]QAY65729.1 GNAT family N-acetyltransferase [Paenibacillus protaetiae]
MIRPAVLNDAAEIARLSGQLGYPVSSSQIEERLIQTKGADHAVYVMDEGDHLLGWVHANTRFLIESAPFVEICGLVVDQTRRGSGIGRQLVQACEQWAAESGYTKIRVRTNQIRTDALKFYTRVGFELNKSQHVLDKGIGRL